VVARRDPGNPQETSVRIPGVPPEIRTQHFLNRSLERYLYTHLFGSLKTVPRRGGGADRKRESEVVYYRLGKKFWTRKYTVYWINTVHPYDHRRHLRHNNVCDDSQIKKRKATYENFCRGTDTSRQLGFCAGEGLCSVSACVHCWYDVTRTEETGRGYHIPTVAPRVVESDEKETPVSGGITGPPCHWWDINTGTWSSWLWVERKAVDPAL
jgi:hypothetical protein